MKTETFTISDGNPEIFSESLLLVSQLTVNFPSLESRN